MSKKKPVSRRRFLKGAASAAAGIAGAPTIIPASALGLGQQPAPSNRIVMGCIGVGNRGGSNMNTFLRYSDIQIVAVCDVDRGRREGARDDVNRRYARDRRSGSSQGCDEYNDFREITQRDDIDAISIGTPDHWHAITMIESAKAGKDIYCEKPLSLTIAQGRAMSDTVKRYGIIFQTGSQQRSSDNFRFGCELVRNGRIGELHTVKVGLPTGPSNDPQPIMPVPEGFDFDRWLGPAPDAPYTKNRCHYEFRWNLDYSGGQLTDWGAHHCDIAQWGMGTEYTGPIEVEGEGNYPANGLYNAATEYHFNCLYKNGVVMEVGSDKYQRGGVTFLGSEGRVFVNRGQIEVEPESLADSVIGPDEIHLYRSGSQHRNFVECVRSRREPIAPIEVAHRSISIAHLGNICMRLGRKVRWDPDIERFKNDPEADRMLSRSMRGTWRV